jgi:hypothetical protein
MDSPNKPGEDLGFPDDDAWDTRDAMVNLAGFSNGNVMALIDSDATRASIEDGFDWLGIKENKNPSVVFSFSGRGGQAPDTVYYDEADGHDEFITPHDASLTGDNIILGDELDEWLSRLESEHIIVVIDSCNSGGIVDLTESEQFGQESSM